jgi:hypothetical protein
MELRYMGFDQASGTRVYRFDCIVAGQPVTHHDVTVEMRLFLEYRVGIQDGPSLCARKLAAGLETEPPSPCQHELTDADMLAFTGERAAAEARKAESRRSIPKPRKSEPSASSSPWRR